MGEGRNERSEARSDGAQQDWNAMRWKERLKDETGPSMREHQGTRTDGDEEGRWGGRRASLEPIQE